MSSQKDILGLPVIENLRDLSSRLVGTVAAQTTSAEGEGHTIRALHRGHAAIPVCSAAAVIAQSHCILHPFLQENTTQFRSGTLAKLCRTKVSHIDI